MKILSKSRFKIIDLTLGKAAMLLLMLLLLIACEESENESKYDPPADHTVSQDGAMHKSGLNDPLANCITCHGADLQGGSSGVSCYECHGRKW